MTLSADITAVTRKRWEKARWITAAKASSSAGVK